MTYTEKLKDPRWQKNRLQIMKRDKFRCQLCGDKETTLHIHHKTYKGNPWQSENDDLITYCEHCHCLVEALKDDNLKNLIPLRVFKEDLEGYVVMYMVTVGINHSQYGVTFFEYNKLEKNITLTSHIFYETFVLINKELQRRIKNK